MDVKVGTILVAHPELPDPCFSRSVILILGHNDDGTIGANIAPSDVLQPPNKDLPQCYPSGPMQGAFVLHETANRESTPIGDSGYALSTGISKAEIADLAQAPSTILLLGYAGWGPGQLADEAEAGVWQPTTLTLSELLQVSVDERWKLAAKNAGFSV